MQKIRGVLRHAAPRMRLTLAGRYLHRCLANMLVVAIGSSLGKGGVNE